MAGGGFRVRVALDLRYAAGLQRLAGLDGGLAGANYWDGFGV